VRLYVIYSVILKKRPRTSLVMRNIEIRDIIMSEFEEELEDHTITIMFDEI
jgi:hypothetical protein